MTTDYKKKLRILTWKKFFKYKLMELILIPLGLLALWKVPGWLGWLVAKIFHINSIEDYERCDYSAITGAINCTQISGDHSAVAWFLGLGTILVLSIFIIANYTHAKENARLELEGRS